jgi:hypothetical protein
MIRLALVLALFVIVAAPTIVLAVECEDEEDPCKNDVTITAYENAPACFGPWNDGIIFASNDSSEYMYKVTVTARAENDSDGNPRCSINDPPGCSGQSCECDLSVSIVADVEDDKVQWEQCILPSCDCDVHCDNDPATECSPKADHCVCVIGTYTVDYYSDDDGVTWTAMAPSYPSVITEKERNPLCADPGLGCD